jgi:hypothetical protein
LFFQTILPMRATSAFLSQEAFFCTLIHVTARLCGMRLGAPSE